ncbi:MAG: O-antigen ligase family protein [Betaproteobacteria bacterium]|nr:O-antigen ligase family protein [Betaproteobacteria bacterium]
MDENFCRRAVLKAAPAVVILWIFLGLALTIDLFKAPSWHDGQRLLQLAALLLASILAIPGDRGGTAVPLVIPAFSMRAAIFSALAAGLVSVLLAPWLRWALLEWSMTCLLLMMGAQIAIEYARAPVTLGRMTVVVFHLAALLYGFKVVLAYGLMFTVGAGYGLAFEVQELFPGFSNVRFFGHIQTLLLPFLVLPALWWSRSTLQRAAWMVAPVLWWFLAIASGTRGSWLALFIGAIVVVAAARGRAIPWLRIQVLALLAGGILYAVLVLGVPEYLSRPTALMHRDAAQLVSLRGREVLWTLAIELIAAHSWFGIGPMHFANRLTELASHPHNAVLQWMAEWGIAAGLLLTLFFAHAGLRFFLTVKGQFQKWPGGDPFVPLALLSALTGAAAQAMVDGLLVMPVSQTLLALLAGWAWAWCSAVQRMCEPAVAPPGWQLPVCSFVMACIVMACSLPEVADLEQRMTRQLNSHHGTTPALLPRFWVHGQIPE